MQLAFRWSKRAFRLTALALAAISCGSPQSAQKTVEPIEFSPPPSASRFAVQPLEQAWSPATYGAGRGPALARELSGVDAVALVLDASVSAAFEDRAIRMVRAAAPATKIVARGRATLNRIQIERGELPYRTTMEPGGVDMFGRPYYLPTEHPLNTDWLQKVTPLKGAGGLLSIAPVKVDTVTLKRMRSEFQGGCDEAIAQLDQNIGRAPAHFAPLIEPINNELRESFRRRLTPAQESWKDELALVAQTASPNSQQCLSEYMTLVDEIISCVSGPCEWTPRLHANAGGMVAVPIIGAALPQTCARLLPRDYVAEYHAIANDAFEDVRSAIPVDWLGEMARLGGLQALRATLEKSCRPQHRRFDPAGLAELNNQAHQITVELADADFPASLVPSRNNSRVAGLGPVRLLAEVQTENKTPLNRVHAFGKALDAAARCDDLRESLIQAALVDVGTSEVRFSAIFFEEELLCEDLAP